MSSNPGIIYYSDGNFTANQRICKSANKQMGKLAIDFLLPG
jgi:hypothetical protein